MLNATGHYFGSTILAPLTRVCIFYIDDNNHWEHVHYHAVVDAMSYCLHLYRYI